MSELFAGIDGGQSSTEAVVGDETGRILGRGAAGPADEVGAAPGSERLAGALRGALDDACRAIPGARGGRFAAVVAAVSGYDGRVRGARPDLPAQRFALVHDAPAAHAGALGGEAGVVVVAGTGSVVYARDEAGEERTYGGWGYCFGDEGSAFWLAREALAATMRAQDAGDGALEPLARAACEFFARASLRQVARAFYDGEIGRDRIAAFAPVALRFDAVAATAAGGAAALAALACRGLAELRLQRVALTGGLFADARFSAEVSNRIRTAAPQARVERAKYEPAEGALLLAYRDAGLPVRELHA